MTSQTYTGEVAVGGAAQVRTLEHLSITKVAVDQKMSNNCYLLACRDTGDQVLIDAADVPETLLALIDGRGLSAVITTHQHWDHHRALAAVTAEHPGAVVAGQEDAEAITEQTGVQVTVSVSDGDRVQIGDSSLEVISIPGHTPGSICLLYEDPNGHPHLFTGDSLFPGGVGATFGDSAAFAQLIDNVEAKIFARLPDETWVYPGHGTDTTLGAERPHLQEWRERGW
ncbi:MBL fold metallo-hydrolase [Nocardioides sp.]|uniref:MBL fold metallo-hydrolase n=1 Tax=Nocardioides sp. TaxID=35761 RepID=UPI0035644CFC